MGRFSPKEYDWFDASLTRLQKAAYSDSPASQFSAQVLKYIDVGEYELALEDIAWHLLEGGRTCPPDLLPGFRDVASRLNMLDNSLIRYVLDGRRALPPKEELPPI